MVELDDLRLTRHHRRTIDHKTHLRIRRPEGRIHVQDQIRIHRRQTQEASIDLTRHGSTNRHSNSSNQASVKRAVAQPTIKTVSKALYVNLRIKAVDNRRIKAFKGLDPAGISVAGDSLDCELA